MVAILKQKDIEIVGEAADGEQTCKLYHEFSPDLLIGGPADPKKDGLQVVTDLVSSPPPKPQNIVLTRYEDKTDARRALKAGPKARMKEMHHHVDPIAEIATKLNLRLTNSSSFRRILTGLAAPRFSTDQFLGRMKQSCLSPSVLACVSLRNA